MIKTHANATALSCRSKNRFQVGTYSLARLGRCWVSNIFTSKGIRQPKIIQYTKKNKWTPGKRRLLLENLHFSGSMLVSRYARHDQTSMPSWLLCSTTKSFIQQLPSPIAPRSPAVPNSKRRPSSFRSFATSPASCIPTGFAPQPKPGFHSFLGSKSYT